MSMLYQYILSTLQIFVGIFFVIIVKKIKFNRRKIIIESNGLRSDIICLRKAESNPQEDKLSEMLIINGINPKNNQKFSSEASKAGVIYHGNLHNASCLMLQNNGAKIKLAGNVKNPILRQLNIADCNAGLILNHLSRNNFSIIE